MELSPFYTLHIIPLMLSHGNKQILVFEGWKAMGRGGTVGVEKYS